MQFSKNGNLLFMLFSVIVFLIIFVIVSVIVLLNVNESTSTYAVFLKQRMLLMCGVILFLILLFSLISMFAFKRIGYEMIQKWMIVVWGVFLCIIITYGIVMMLSHYFDILHEDYIVYVGEFKKDHTRQILFLNDENSTRLVNTQNTYLDPGDYKGEIIYSKRTKYVLDYTLDASLNELSS